jgi:hypothetical protein
MLKSLQSSVYLWWLSVSTKKSKTSKSPELQARAEKERNEAFNAVSEVYRRNMVALLGDHELLSEAILGGYNYTDINQMFLWGLYSAFVTGRAPLPTEPYERIQVHLMNFLIQHDETTFLEARNRVVELEKIYSDRDYMMDKVVAIGRSALASEADDSLMICHWAFVNRKYYPSDDQNGPWEYAFVQSMKRAGVFSTDTEKDNQ